MRVDWRDGHGRVRSGAEVAFMVMRILVMSRLLWQDGGALPLDRLETLIDVPGDQLATALERLCDEGIAQICLESGTLRLTDGAAVELLGCPPPSAAATFAARPTRH
jgi:hypothetical protein